MNNLDDPNRLDFLERRRLVCVPVPGEGEWVADVAQERPTRSGRSSFDGTNPNVVDQQRGKNKRPLEGEAIDHDAVMMDVDEGAHIPTMGMNEAQQDGGDPKVLKTGDCRSTVQDQQDGDMAAMDKNALFSVLVILYDQGPGQEQTGSDVRVNEVVDVIGVLSCDPHLTEHSVHDPEDDLDDDYFQLDQERYLERSMVPRIHALLVTRPSYAHPMEVTSFHHSRIQALPNLSKLLLPPLLLPASINAIREETLCYLAHSLGEDHLASEYLLLCLLSRPLRCNDRVIGHLPINFSSSTPSTNLPMRLRDCLSLITPRCRKLDVHVQSLNTPGFLQPRRDIQSGALITASLQVSYLFSQPVRNVCPLVAYALLTRSGYHKSLSPPPPGCCYGVCTGGTSDCDVN